MRHNIAVVARQDSAMKDKKNGQRLRVHIMILRTNTKYKLGTNVSAISDVYCRSAVLSLSLYE